MCRNFLSTDRGGSRAQEQSDKGQCLTEVSLVLPWWHGWPWPSYTITLLFLHNILAKSLVKAVPRINIQTHWWVSGMPSLPLLIWPQGSQGCLPHFFPHCSPPLWHFPLKYSFREAPAASSRAELVWLWGVVKPAGPPLMAATPHTPGTNVTWQLS